MLKKLILKLVLILSVLTFLQVSSAQANFKYKLGQKVTDKFNVHKKSTIPLPKGEWEVVYKESENIFRGIYFYYVLLAQVENNIPIKLFGISKVNGITTSYGLLSSTIIDATFKSKKHGCVERNYYSSFEFYRGGAAHNCFTVQHVDVYDELYNIEPWQSMGFFLNWVKKNKIQLGEIYLDYSGYMYLPRVADRWMSWGYLETPESFADYKTKNKSRDTSEFHPNNISQHDDAKKVMKDFISFAANYHEEIQNSLKVKGKKNRLDLTSYISNNSLKSETDIDNKKKSESAASSEDLPKDLQKLKDLYELEVITEEQFKEAIEKLYN